VHHADTIRPHRWGHVSVTSRRAVRGFVRFVRFGSVVSGGAISISITVASRRRQRAVW
jgi:hypothetical protein